MTNVCQNQIKRYLDLLEKPEEDLIMELIATQNSDGSYDDIPKIGDGNPYDFRFNYCERIRKIALGYKVYKKEEYANVVIRGLNWWLECDFTKTMNWFHNIINIPRILSDTLMCVHEVIDEKLKEDIISKIKVGSENDRGSHDIGANLIWINIIKLHLAYICEDEKMLLEATAKIDDEVRFADDHSKENLVQRNLHWRTYIDLPIENNVYEGIQRDYSFLEHGPMLYTGVYGDGYFTTVCNFLYECYESNHFNKRVYNFILDFLLEHLVWTRIGENGEVKESSSNGRRIANYDFEKVNTRKNTTNLLTYVNLLLSLNQNYRKNELQTLCENLKAKKATVNGVKYFPNAKYLVMQTENFVSAVKLTSANMIASEAVNWENLRCWYLGDGVLYSYVDGDEYENVFSSYDWTKMPAVTSTDKQLEPLDKVQHTSIQATSSNLCAGLSNKDYAVASMEVIKSGFSMKKSFIMSKASVLVMGADICSDEQVQTTVEQCKLKTAVLIDGEKMQDENCIKNIKELEHNGLTYRFYDNENITVETKKVRKNIFDITYNDRPQKPQPPIYVENDMFIAYINHYTKNSFAYSVESEKSNYEILCNNRLIQAVLKDDILFITFWSAGEYDFRNKKIKVNKPCIVILDGENINCIALHENEKQVKVQLININ